MKSIRYMAVAQTLVLTLFPFYGAVAQVSDVSLNSEITIVSTNNSSHNDDSNHKDDDKDHDDKNHGGDKDCDKHSSKKGGDHDDKKCGDHDDDDNGGDNGNGGNGGDNGDGGNGGDNGDGGNGTTTPPVVPDPTSTTTPPVVPPVPLLGGSVAGGGTVLGAETDTPSTTTPAVCGLYITTFMRLGKTNDSAEVTKLQTFLNSNLNLKIATDGVFSIETDSAVRQFQAKYASEVITPWVNLGYLPTNATSTGYVYKTTQYEINHIVCPTLDIAFPKLP